MNEDRWAPCFRGSLQTARCLVIALFWGLLCALPAVGHAQQTSEPDTIQPCQPCGTIRVDTVATLYDRDGEAGLTPPSPIEVLRVPQGGFLVISANPFEPFLFDEDGVYSGMLGREGEGPGEYQSPASAWIGPDETLWTFDRGLQRATKWTDEWEVADTRRLPVRSGSMVIFEDGTLVNSSPVMDADRVGYPFHRISADGELGASFGPEVQVAPTGHLPGHITRLLWPAGSESFWAAPRHKYKIERYNLQGQRERALVRAADWFPDQDPTESRAVSPESPPPPRIGGFVEDDEGRLRVLARVAADGWEEGVGERQPMPGFDDDGPHHHPIDHDIVFGSVIEVLDPVSGQLVASRRLQGLALQWVDESHVAMYTQDRFDIPIIHIVQVAVVDP